MKTEVILKQDIVGLGEEGDIKKVAGGYARNYLLPFGHAVPMTQANMKKLEAEREAINVRKKEKLDASKSFLEKLNAVELSYVENAAENGRLFGSISLNDIQVQLKEQGYDLDKKQIHLPDAIKFVGSHSVEVKLYGDLVAKIKVNVKSSSAETEIPESEEQSPEEPQVEASQEAQEEIIK